MVDKERRWNLETRRKGDYLGTKRRGGGNLERVEDQLTIKYTKLQGVQTATQQPPESYHMERCTLKCIVCSC